VDYNVYGGRTKLTDAHNHVYNVEYDSATFMPKAITDSLGTLGPYTYDTRCNPLTQTDGANGTSEYQYDQYGRLVCEKDAEGRITLHSYDLMGRRITTTTLGNNQTTCASTPNAQSEVTFYKYDALGRVVEVVVNAVPADGTGVYDPLFPDRNLRTTYVYDPNGNRKRMIDPLNRETEWVYDAANRVVETHYPDGGISKTDYDFRGNVTEQTDPEGVKTCYDYDKAGRLEYVTNACETSLAGITTYTYDVYGRQKTVISPAGVNFNAPTNSVTENQYDKSGRLIKVTRAKGTADQSITQYVYNNLGQRTQIIDANNNSTYFEYDARGRLKKTFYGTLSGPFTEITYDGAGRQLTITDERGVVTENGYDASGILETVIAANLAPSGLTAISVTTSYTYDSLGRLTLTTDPAGRKTFQSYNVAGQLIATTLGYQSDVASTTTYTYDTAGQQKTVWTVADEVTSFEYDAMGRLKKTIHPDGTFEETFYDLAGRIDYKTDGNQNITNYSYDVAGRLESVTNAENETIWYEYYPDGQIKKITDARGRETKFEYDYLGRQSKKTWPDGSDETWEYDGVGNLVRRELTDHTIYVFTYDNRNRLDIAEYGSGTNSQIVDYDYDAAGNVLTVKDITNPLNVIVMNKYTYDALNRPTLVELPTGQTVGYEYNAAGERLKLTTPAGVVNYIYDMQGRLKTVTDSTVVGTADYVYDAAGRLDTLTLPNGVVSEYEYTRRGWVETLTQRQSALGPILAKFDYTNGYDAAGNRVSGTETLNGNTSYETTVSISWSYDDANRLIFEERKHSTSGTPFRTTSYVYDDAGNRESETLNGETTIYLYNNLDQLTSTLHPTEGTTAYTYDGRGNLTQVSVNNVVQSSYGYDVRDRMVEAYVPGSSIIYSYNDDGRRVAETINGVTKRFIWDEFSAYGDVVAETDASNAVTASYVLGGNQILWQTVSGTTHFLLADAQGSTRTLTDNVSQNAQIQSTYNFTAFGETLDHNGSADSRYLYTGQQFDPLTQLYSLRARYYSPSNGRFLSRDTWAYNYQNPVEFNRYVYAANNPVRYFDPSGNNGTEHASINMKVVAVVVVGVLGAGSGCRVIDCGSAIFDILDSLLDHIGDGLKKLFDPLAGNPSRSSEASPSQVSSRTKAEDLSRYFKKGKHISLGIQAVPGKAPLFDLTYNLNYWYNPFGISVYPFYESGLSMGFDTTRDDVDGKPWDAFGKGWFDAQLSTVAPSMNLELSTRQAMKNAQVIHFTLEGIQGDPIAFADNHGGKGNWDNATFYTAAELYVIKEDPELCSKTVFYSESGELLSLPQPDFYKMSAICGSSGW
jgi:RHS repeat-associated protein